ncbi:hypothetical protein Rt10032_c03g1634 [Rhodotorula toruloides]|uniref:Uncharacterized protein n=1 Tax=Rhodotorula toruloides TaxID=5286 RepID=A0A511KB55_RHOTO|nr:hypothetical protein Rt10032_c03g1634 [Rhodotorula toruloides]
MATQADTPPAALAPPLSPTSLTRPSPPRPPTRSSQHGSPGPERRDATWREEQAVLHHQLRLAKAEIANLQAKLGIKANGAPFNVHSPRKTSLLSADAPFPSSAKRRPSLSDLSASTSSSSTPRRISGASETEAGAPVSSATTSPPSSTYPSPQLSSSPRASSSPRTSHAPDRVPGHVAMNRALLSNEGHGSNETLQIPSTDRAPSPSSSARLAPPDCAASSSSLRPSGLPRPRSPNPTSSTSSNPFFGSSGASRERLSKSAASAQSGSGKVISGLQSDLLQTRSALETTRGQLRLSQRAVEALGRQVDDLKETKERLTSEIEGLNRQITRKERLQDEALQRARTAEASLAALQKEHNEFKGGVKGKMKELEEGARQAEEARTKSEREYLGLRDGLRTMQEGWREDLKWLREDLAKSQRELEVKTATISKLLASRTSLSTTIDSDLSSLRSTHTTFTEQHASSTTAALKELQNLSNRSEADSKKADELGVEFVRLRRAMAEYREGDCADAEGGGQEAEVQIGAAG